MPHPYFAGAAHPRILAHRGFVTADLAAQGVVGNSRAAMAAALDAGADYLETDCRMTSDGVVVLFHDADLLRLLGDERKVAEISHRELAALMADRGGLLTLAQAFEEFPQARLNVDIKAAEAPEAAGRIIAPHADRALINSFSDARRLRALAAAVAARPGGPRPATSPGRGTITRVLGSMAWFSRARTAHVLADLDALQIPERQGPVRVLSRRLLAAAHRAGVEVHVWTINDPQRMEELARLGVDGIVTDRTDFALSVLGRFRRGDRG